MSNIKQLLLWAQNTLTNGCESAAIDAEVLLCHVLNCSRTYLYSHPEIDLDDQSTQAYHRLIKSRQSGCPVAYLTGRQAFWTLDLKVNKHTLIPRHETELLVELALQQLKSVARPHIIDLGTGSGAIALAIAAERQDATIYAIDSCFEAIKVALQNKQHYQFNQVNLICSHWLDAIRPSSQLDLIVTNPPYIADNDPHLSSSIRYEPQQALTSGKEGLDAVKEILSVAKPYLKPDGSILIEHGYDQSKAIHALLNNNGYVNICTWQDHSSLDRVTSGQRPAP